MFKSRREYLCSKLLPNQTRPTSPKISSKHSVQLNNLLEPLYVYESRDLTTNQTEKTIIDQHSTLDFSSHSSSCQQTAGGHTKSSTHINRYSLQQFIERDDGNIGRVQKVSVRDAMSINKRGVLGSRQFKKISLKNMPNKKMCQRAQYKRIFGTKYKNMQMAQ